MSVWLVVPVKSLRSGKSRLSAVLEADQRAAFLEWLLVRTLQHAAGFPGLEHTLVVSACEHALACAKTCGAHVLREHEPAGLNSALRQAQRELQHFGIERMLIASCDLPLLGAADLQALAAASMDRIALAPDRCKQGTNAIALESSAPLQFAFGSNSFGRHLDCIRRIGRNAAIVERAGLAFDIDLPEDLAQFRALAPEDFAPRCNRRSWLEPEPR